jgi:PBP1b-binding outer membrane lipoprotein LpoB
MKKILLLFLILFLVSCNEKENKKNENTDNQTQSITLKSVDKKTQGLLEINKTIVRKLEPVELKFKLLNKANITGDVTIELVMPDMPMPRNEIKLKSSESNLFSGIVIFTMKGKWGISVNTVVNGQNEKFYFELGVD